MPGPRAYIAAPQFTPAPYGLLSVVDPVDAPPDHWQNGVNYQPMCSSVTGTYDECIAVTGAAVSGAGLGSPPPPWAMRNVVDATTRAATAFTIAVEFECSAVGNADARATARAAFLSQEAFAVEYAFWTGNIFGQDPSAITVFPHLAADAEIIDTTSPTVPIVVQTEAIVVTGGNKDAVEVIGTMEAWLGYCYSGVGVLHVTEEVLDTMAANNLVVRNGPRLYTPNGNKIAVGSGYYGLGPSGQEFVPGTSWVYATGNISMIRDEMRIRATGPEAFNRATNTITMIAERTYLLFWDCCHFAGLIEGLGAPKGN